MTAFGGDGKAEPRKYSLPNTFRSADSNAALDGNRHFDGSPSDAPAVKREEEEEE